MVQSANACSYRSDKVPFPASTFEDFPDQLCSFVREGMRVNYVLKKEAAG